MNDSVANFKVQLPLKPLSLSSSTLPTDIIIEDEGIPLPQQPAAAMAIRRIIMLRGNHHPGNIGCLPHRPGVQFRGL